MLVHAGKCSNKHNTSFHQYCQIDFISIQYVSTYSSTWIFSNQVPHHLMKVKAFSPILSNINKEASIYSCVTVFLFSVPKVYNINPGCYLMLAETAVDRYSTFVCCILCICKNHQEIFLTKCLHETVGTPWPFLEKIILVVRLRKVWSCE